MAQPSIAAQINDNLKKRVRFRGIALSIIILKISLAGLVLHEIYYSPNAAEPLVFDQLFLFVVVAGFLAQVVDGALGMAYGISCSSLLLGLGVSPAIASASVHTAEVFTTGISGLSHILLRNVDKSLLVKLLAGGLPGAAVGAYVLSGVVDGELIKPFIAIYLCLIGLRLLLKSMGKLEFKAAHKHVFWLGLFGGFLDSVGGGGWGPVVTSNLISRGNTPKITIGTVNTAEFFVAFVSTGVFLYFVGIQSWPTVLGLVLGGLVAAPIGAFLVTRISPTLILRLVGVLILLTSGYVAYQSWAS